MTAGMLPKLALSVRQPWAWAIIAAGKDIENRTWNKGNPGLKFRGPVCIHAAKGMTRGEYLNAMISMERECDVDCPRPDELLRGAIIGTVEIVDIVRESDSPWFQGRNGLVLANAIAIEPIPAVGALGFFEWRQDGALETPRPWMVNYPNDKPAKADAGVAQKPPPSPLPLFD